MPDYFPLAAGASAEFALKDSSGTVRHTIEILEVAAADGTTTAKCRRTVSRPGSPPASTEFTAIKDAAGVRSGEMIEFNHPLVKGTEWIGAPRRFWIEDLNASTETPAGAFHGCLRVAYLIAEGDGGSGERFYAPGVGLVKIIENDESEPFTYQLVKKTRKGVSLSP